MPRHRQRKTDWKPQDQRRLRARGIRREVPDVRKLSRAFIGLALARAEAETQARADALTRSRDQAGAGGRTDADSSSAEVSDDSR